MIASLFTLFFVLPASAADTLTLKDAAKRATELNPSIKETAERITQASTEIPLARSALYPGINGVLSDTRMKDATGFGTPKFGGDPYTQYSTSLKVNQPLFQYGSFAAISAAEKDVKLARIDTVIAQRDLLASVIETYFAIHFAEKNLEILQVQENIAKEGVQVALKRERTGRSQLLDSLQAKTQLELLHGQISTAENSLNAASARLANLLGGALGSEKLKLAPIGELPSLAQVSGVGAGKDQLMPEIEKDEVALSRIGDLRQVTRGQNLPTLGLIGSFNFNSYSETDLIRSDANSWTLGLQLTIPLFSGFSSLEQDRALASQQTQLQLNRASVENQYAYQRTTSQKALETAQASILSGNEGLKLAVASSNEARRNYRLATIDFLQYLSVQQARAQAELALNSSRLNYVGALIAYFTANGRDLSELIETLEP